MEREVEEVAENERVGIDALRAAYEQTMLDLGSIRADLARSDDDFGGMSVVFTGSYGRREVTRDSDGDYLLLIDRTPDEPRKLTRLSESVRTATEGMRDYGGSGTFGDIVIATELLARIGLQGDTNVTTTRRLLLICESVSVLNDEVRSATIRRLLARYCYDYDPSSGRERHDRWHVPRFLLNDLVRYWRTMTVDFGAKQWATSQSEWYLRYAKLLTTRKLLFAGSLATVFLPAFVLPAHDPAERHRELVDHLCRHADLTPLARLMSLYPYVGPDARAALGGVLAAHDQFIALMRMTTTVSVLRRRADDPTRIDVSARMERAGEEIQRHLETVFFDDDRLGPLTRRYGLF